jgi:hypothetical protein
MGYSTMDVLQHFKKENPFGTFASQQKKMRAFERIEYSCQTERSSS